MEGMSAPKQGLTGDPGEGCQTRPRPRTLAQHPIAEEGYLFDRRHVEHQPQNDPLGLRQRDRNPVDVPGITTDEDKDSKDL